MSTKETQLVTQKDVKLVISELSKMVEAADTSQFLVSDLSTTLSQLILFVNGVHFDNVLYS